MPKLRSIRHETFAQFVAGGMPAAQAYREVTGRTQNGDVHGAEFIRRTDIKARIAELRTLNDKKATVTREEVIRFLSDVITAPISQVSTDSPLAQSYKDTGGGHELRICDKLNAIAQLSKLCGWDSPQRIELGFGDSLTLYLSELRAQPIGDCGRPAMKALENGNGR